MIFTDTVCNYLISRTVTARVEIRKVEEKKKGRKRGEKHPADFSLHMGGNFERTQKGLENIRKY